MPLPVTVYRWDDAGAPSITGQKPTDIINILKKCLVEGYGTKQPLGWEIAFEDVAALKIVFRNSMNDGGSGGFVKFWSDNDNIRTSLFLHSAASATSVDDLFNVGYTKLVACTHQTSRWALIGTSRGFYLFLSDANPMAYSPIYNASVFIGDIDAVLPMDAGMFIVGFPSHSDATSVSWAVSLDYLSVGAHSFAAKVYDADGHASYGDYCGIAPFGKSNQLPCPDGLFSPTMFAKIPFIINYANYGRDITTSDRDGVSHVESQTRPILRGFVTGMVQSMGAGGKALTWPQIINDNGVDYWMLRAANAKFTDKFIRLDEWY